jgi:hypothetical protein
MKTVALLVTLLSLLSAAFAQSPASSADDACKKTEYAELKDSPKNRLLSTFCRYEAFRDIEAKAFDDFEALAKKYGNDGDVDMARRALDSANKHRLQSAQCSDEATRVARALESVYHISRPTQAVCDARMK